MFFHFSGSWAAGGLINKTTWRFSASSIHSCSNKLHCEHTAVQWVWSSKGTVKICAMQTVQYSAGTSQRGDAATDTTWLLQITDCKNVRLTVIRTEKASFICKNSFKVLVTPYSVATRIVDESCSVFCAVWQLSITGRALLLKFCKDRPCCLWHHTESNSMSYFFWGWSLKLSISLGQTSVTWIYC